MEEVVEVWPIGHESAFLRKSSQAMERWQPGCRCQLQKRRSLCKEQWVVDSIQCLSFCLTDIREGGLELIGPTDSRETQLNFQGRCSCFAMIDLAMLGRVIRVPHHRYMAEH